MECKRPEYIYAKGGKYSAWGFNINFSIKGGQKKWFFGGGDQNLSQVFNVLLLIVVLRDQLLTFVTESFSSLLISYSFITIPSYSFGNAEFFFIFGEYHGWKYILENSLPPSNRQVSF
jgi:hypothetical protein